MKKKVWLWAVLCAVIFVFAGAGFTVVKLVDYDLAAKRAEMAELDDFFVREDAEQTKAEQFGTEEENTLTYEESKQLNENLAVDIYKDGKEDEYSYQGEALVGYYNPPNELSEQPQYPEAPAPLAESQALEIAESHAKELYGEDFEKHTLAENLSRADGKRSVIFVTLYGKEAFIRGSVLTVTVRPDGVVRSSGLADRVMMDLDPTLFDHVEKKYVDTEVERQLQETYKAYAGQYTYEITQYKLVQEEGVYKVRVSYTLRHPEFTKASKVIVEIPEK